MEFCKGWSYWKEGSAEVKEVTLPHDAQLTERRFAEAASGNGGAFFDGGLYHYEKKFFVPKDWEEKNLWFEFEGVYRNPEVFLNGKKAGEWRYGYSRFFVCADGFLQYDAENVIHVTADNSETPNSRWYSGAGIYRPVHLHVKNRHHIALDGVTVKTLSHNPARISVDVDASEGDVRVEILYQGQLVAAGEGRHLELDITDAHLWSAETPDLYECRAMLLVDKEVCDEVTETFGIRTISWDTKGFYINGKSVLLQGGCLHHDNGIVGAASFEKLERRKVQILKEYGYNAIRSAHNPISKGMLRACDELGMYIMDEAFDMWYIHKTKYDYSRDFEDWYDKDLAAMVKKDRNHPSVVLYSTGNEVTEPHEAKGVEYAKKMTKLLHELDDSRPVTSGVNIMLLMMAASGKAGFVGESLDAVSDNKAKKPKKEKKPAKKEKEEISGSALFNMIMSSVGQRMDKAATTKKADKASIPYCDALDICGYNYASGRYPIEGKLHPERLLFGSETMHYNLAKNWAMVKKYDYVIGDFCWTAWDYLGECGIGGWSHDPGISFGRKYPWILADTGALDLLGDPTGPAALAKAVWGAADRPEIYVRPVSKLRYTVAMWRGTNSIPSWSFRGKDGIRTIVEVYTDAPAAELFLNGKSLGIKKAKDYVAEFKVKYEPGVLEAKAIYADGTVKEALALISSTGSSSLALTPEDETILPGEIAVVHVEIQGNNGVTESGCEKEVEISVEGGELLAFGSAAQKAEGSFLTGKYWTRYGKAMAIVRGVEPGNLTVRAKAEGVEEGICTITVVPRA